jgi:hypothetical protein
MYDTYGKVSYFTTDRKIVRSSFKNSQSQILLLFTLKRISSFWNSTLSNICQHVELAMLWKLPLFKKSSIIYYFIHNLKIKYLLTLNSHSVLVRCLLFKGGSVNRKWKDWSAGMLIVIVLGRSQDFWQNKCFLCRTEICSLYFGIIINLQKSLKNSMKSS